MSDLAELQRLLPGLPAAEQAALNARLKWLATARPDQLIDLTDDDHDVILLLAGRGFGKTRTAAECAWWFCYTHPNVRAGFIAPTMDDLRKVIFEGESGLQSVIPPLILAGGTWQNGVNTTLHQIHFANGSVLTGYTSERPNRLRGPNLHILFMDELAAYEHPQILWDVSRFGLRLGSKPKTIITTTPKPIPLLFALTKDPTVKVISGSTYDNLQNLAPEFRRTLLAYEGTQFGRQEIHAELLRDNTGAIFDRAWLRIWPNKLKTPDLRFLLTSYDTAYTEKTDGSDTAWVTMGVIYNENTQRNAAIVLDAGSGNIGYPALRKQVLKDWRAKRNDRLPDIALIEAKGAGLSLLSDFRDEGVIMHSYHPKTDKRLRAHTVSHLVSNGMLMFPENEDKDQPGRLPPWARPLVNQFLLFPNAEKDDYVDAIVQGLHYLRDQQWLSMDRATPPDEVDAANEYAAEKTANRGNPYMV